ncbi:protein ENL [Callorhinchus milii]|nr:protein ENL [Callorhinchus milii]|eukprot:gi/632966014/ref/XP_007899184.1/ PREDICTED: protein ENL [Callorhinchus milii]
MDNQCTVQVKLELGHRAQLRKKPTPEGFTHDWMVFVRGPEQSEIQHFVEKVVFRLHESFPKPKRVCKEPSYKVEESGYAGFIMPIDVYFKNKEEPKKVCFTYDLFLNLEGNPPVNHLRCEKLTFNNPTKEFRRKLLKAGGIMVMPEGTDTPSRPSPDYPMLPTIPLSAFSDPKKSKPSHGSKDTNRESKSLKLHKVTKEHKERPAKDPESKTPFKESEKEHSKSSKDSSRKPTEAKVPKEEKATAKATSKEPKPAFKESKLDGTSPKGGGGASLQQETKPSVKRPSNLDSLKPSAKKQKKSTSETSKFPGTSPRISSSSSSYSEKRQVKEKEKEKEKVNVKVEKAKVESTVKEVKKAVDSDDCNSEDEVLSKTESVHTSPCNSSSSSDSSSDSDFAPSQNHRQGPLRSMVEEIQSEGSDDDSSSEEERPVKNSTAGRENRLSLSDDSESESSENSHIHTQDQTLIQKHITSSNKTSGRKSPESCDKTEKFLKKGLQDKSYTEELVDLHRRLMALRERNVLQQIVNLIEETGHFNVTNTTFDFDLFSLDETTVRKLQSYLEATAT